MPASIGSERYLGDLCPDQRPLWKRTERGNQYPSDIQREDLKTAGFRLRETTHEESAL